MRKTKKFFSYLLVSIGFSIFSMPVFATDIMDIYNQALQSDPVYQAARSTRLSVRETVPQNVAGLLPTVAGTADQTRNVIQTLRAPPSASASKGTTVFNSSDYMLTLTQPLINFGNWMLVRQADATAKQADATFGAAGQNLIFRVAQAYFNVLLAQDVLRATEAQKAANARQLDQVQQRFKVGLDAVTSVYNAQAQYDATVAQEITDQNALRNSQEALRQLTGLYYTTIENFKIEIPLITPQPANIEQWVSAAEKQNLTLLASRFATEAARANVKVNFAGHLPTLSAVGTYERSNGQSLGTVNTNNKTAGLQLTLPIFQGGLIASQTRQAEYDYATASANRENIYRQTIVKTRQNYNDVLAGISKIKADRQAIVSAQSSLDSTEESFKVGTRTIVDVLLSVQTLYLAQRVYATDEYAYLLSTLALKQSAGLLSVNDLNAINTWIHAVPEKNTAKKLRG